MSFTPCCPAHCNCQSNYVFVYCLLVQIKSVSQSVSQGLGITFCIFTLKTWSNGRLLSEYQYIFIFGILFYILTLTLTVCCICVISCVVLEGEMYQLSHLLTDQKTVMTSMMELSITGNKGKLDVCNNYSWQGP